MNNVAIVYDSRTHNVERFMKRFPQDIEICKVGEIDSIDKPFVFVTYTTGTGMVPESSLAFLNANSKNLLGVASSGSRNWGQFYALAADKISSLFNVPIITKFELAGSLRVANVIMDFMKIKQTI